MTNLLTHLQTKRRTRHKKEKAITVPVFCVSWDAGNGVRFGQRDYGTMGEAQEQAERLNKVFPYLEHKGVERPGKA